ncbi:MAG TPA: hypothetical protein VLM40_17965 [Gemmata sp.]|nr:hypothetical protein [Gemmata sp.]
MSTTASSLTVAGTLHIARRGRGGARELRIGPAPSVEEGRLPRVARLMALAIRFDQLVRNGTVADYAELARLGRVTRARITQVMNLLNLAPNIQEELLFLPRVVTGRDPIILRDLQPIAAVANWTKQMAMWCELT